MGTRIDLVGQTFGKLTVERFAGNTENLDSTWRCKCECGAFTVVRTNDLRRRHTQSCGCLRREMILVSHRQSYTSTYRAWQAMRARCLNPTANAFHHYGGRGISICKRWDSFENFFADMGEKPTSKHSLGRLKNGRGYSPANCEWQLRGPQNRNKRNNRFLTIERIKQTLTEWSEVSRFHYNTIRYRLKIGWTPRQAVFGKS